MDDGALTVPNFLRTYNPNLIGGSLSHHFSEVRHTHCIYTAYPSQIRVWVKEA